MTSREDALRELREYREMNARRDEILCSARAAGINIRQIALESGLSRDTVYKALGSTGAEPGGEAVSLALASLHLAADRFAVVVTD